MGGQKPGDGSFDGEASTVAHTPDPTVAASRESQPSIELQVGEQIGRYRIQSRLGAGAMGVVFCAFDPQLDRKVAIKVVHASLARSPDASTRLLREARAMAKLSHRAVVTVHDAGDVEGRLFLAMELVQGTTLGQMLRARTDEERRNWKKWLSMMLEAGRGLEAAHGGGVLHRDFKPDNVLVDARGPVCVGDFGLATLGESERVTPNSERASKLREGAEAAVDLTTTGALLGTPAYMSLQQLRGEAIDARADQFNFCVATYEALYGRRPFAAQGEGMALIDSLERTIAGGEILPPPDDTAVPDEVFDVLRHGLAAYPEDRWPNMTALLGELERASKLRKRTHASRAISVPSVTQATPNKRPLVFAAIAGAALASLVVVGVLVLAGRDPQGASLPPPRVAKRLFDVSLKTEVAMSADGRRVALGSDRLEVRELDTGRAWTGPLLAGKSDISAVAIDEHVVRFGLRSAVRPGTWRYMADAPVEIPDQQGPGIWHGESAIGDVFYQMRPVPMLLIAKDGVELKRWPTTTIVESVAISPDRKRVASLESDRFAGRVVVRDVARDVIIQSPEMASPTALAWQDDRTLVYGTGTTDEPRIFRVRIEDDKLGEPEVIYGRDYGWFGEIAIANKRMLFVEMNPRSRARLIAGAFTRELDTANIAVALGWIGDGQMLTWNRSSKRVEKRSSDGTLEPTRIELVAEPANATIANDVLMSAIRRTRGRELVAHSLTTGERLWSHDPAHTLAVRCADDVKPPCFAIRAATTSLDQVVPIDPATGKLGETVLAEGAIEDIAVNASGSRLLVAVRTGEVREIDATGAPIANHGSPLPTVRSIAYVSNGSFMVAGTALRNTFQVGRVVDGKFTLVSQAENDLLSLVRPSPDGSQVLILSRVYAPTLWELRL